MLPAVDPVAAPPPETHRLSCDAQIGPAFWLGLKLQLLKLITLFVYRFWAESRIRRVLWHSIRLHGDRFEYHGTGGQMFRGALMVAALFVAITLISTGLVLLGSGSEWRLLESSFNLILGLSLFLVVPYFSWKYRVRNTSWRGIRLAFRGTVKTFFADTAGYMLISVFTLGIAYPVASVAVRRYLLQHTAIGTLPLAAQHGPIGRVWVPFLLAIGLVPIGLGAGWAVFSESIATRVLVGAACVVGVMLALGWYRAVETRLLLSELRLGDARVTVQIQPWKFALLALVPGIFWVTALLIGGLVFWELRALPGIALAGLGIGYAVLAFFLYGAINLPFRRLPWVRMMANGTALVGRVDWATVAQDAAESPTAGSIGDAIDLAV